MAATSRTASATARNSFFRILLWLLATFALTVFSRRLWSRLQIARSPGREVALGQLPGPGGPGRRN
jgi:hypothetical protein